MDDLQGGTSLLGVTAEEQAETLMWLVRLENKLLGPMERMRASNPPVACDVRADF